jgi:hypothetical protein
MHPYIPHLLADIAAAYPTEIPEEKTLPKTLKKKWKK